MSPLMSATVISITANDNNNNDNNNNRGDFKFLHIILHLQCVISILWWNVGMTITAGSLPHMKGSHDFFTATIPTTTIAQPKLEPYYISIYSCCQYCQQNASEVSQWKYFIPFFWLMYYLWIFLHLKLM